MCSEDIVASLILFFLLLLLSVYLSEIIISVEFFTCYTVVASYVSVPKGQIVIKVKLQGLECNLFCFMY